MPPLPRPPRRLSLRLLALLLAPALGGLPAHAQPPPQPVPPPSPRSAAEVDPLAAAVHAGRWAEADTAAAGLADPVARKLVAWLRLIAHGGGQAHEIAAFMAANPDWPGQALLARRRDEAIVAESSAVVAVAECTRPAPFTVSLAAALLRCAEAETALPTSGSPQEAPADADTPAAGFARRAWVTGPADPAWETRTLARWGAVLRPEDQRARFVTLSWSNPAAALRQIPRLATADQPPARAWAALRQNAPNVPALLAALPEAARTDPALVLEEARWLRRSGRIAAALTLWAGPGRAAEAAAGAPQQAALWGERNNLARTLLRAGDAARAYAVADGFAGSGGEARLDADFFAAFLALRRLDRPDQAEPHLRALLALSASAITQSRGHYWLARLAEARRQPERARAEYAAAAAYPATYYGQLAVEALGESPQARVRAAILPPAPPARVADFVAHELARAAIWLVAWGESGRAQSFLLRLGDTLSDPVDRLLTARLAEGLGLPQTAIGVARRAGRDGLTLLPQGWPLAASIPAGSGVEPALVLGVIRQESSFDTATVSPAGARGLMQLMPATAAEVATRQGLHLGPTTLTADPQTNILLGTTYLAGLLARFQGAVPLAVAAYNAGPGRVTDWLSGYGDPRTAGGPEMIDWIEEIPIGETRNYVQRVLENQVVYRAELAAPQDSPKTAPQQP